jgi:hypothetical protein
MLTWLFPLFVLSWIAIIVTGRRAQQSLSKLDPAEQQRFREAPSDRIRPAVLLNAVVRGQYRDVADPAFVRSCTAYRLALYSYFATLGILIVAIGCVIIV